MPSSPLSKAGQFLPLEARSQTRSLEKSASTAGANKQAKAESRFRAAFLRQLLEPLTQELVSTPGSGKGVGSGMETYRFFLEEALSQHLEASWPLPDMDLNPKLESARQTMDVQRAAASYGSMSQMDSISMGSGSSGMGSWMPSLRGAQVPPSLLSQISAPRPVTSDLSTLPTNPNSLQPRSPSSVPETLLQSIRKAAQAESLPDSLVRAVVEMESGGNSQAVSPVGAEGLMQLMPATAKDLGVEDSFDPEQNLAGGTKYLAEQLKRFDGDLSLALAAYNAGPGTVKRYGGIPPYPETQNYVRSVLAMKSKFDQESGAAPIAEK